MTKILKLITGICLITFLCSCKDDEEKVEQINPIKNKKTIILNDDGVHTEEITIFEFEGCEYIMYEKNRGSKFGVLGLTHKGNCKYCAEKN